jgi:hypothetical protein
MKSAPTAQDIAAISASSVTEQILNEAIISVHDSYKALGASDQVAKGVDLLAQLKNKLRTRFSGIVTP